MQDWATTPSGNSPTLWRMREIDPPGRMPGSTAARMAAATPPNTYRQLRDGWTGKKNPEKLAR